MPDAVVVELADAVVTALNGESFSQEFTSARKYRPVFDLKDLTTLTVTVVARSVEVSLATRDMLAERYAVDVAVQKQLSASADSDEETAAIVTAADALMLLVEEIRDFLVLAEITLTGSVLAKCLEVRNTPVYDPEHFDKHRCFTSVVIATYDLVRVP